MSFGDIVYIFAFVLFSLHERQQDHKEPPLGIDPRGGPGEARMAKRSGREQRSRGRPLR